MTLDLDTRKPAFRWLGKDGLDEFVKELEGKNGTATTTPTAQQEEPDLLTNIYNALLNLPNQNQNESLNKKRSPPQNINSFEAKTKKKISSSK